MVVYVANACGCLDTRIGPAFGQSQILLGQHLAGLSVSHKLAREKHGLGVFGPDVVEIMQHADDRAPFGMPTADQMRQIADRTRIDGAVGFVKQDQGGVLQHEAGETGTLQLPPGKLPDGAGFESTQSDCGNGVVNSLAGSVRNAAEGAEV